MKKVDKLKIKLKTVLFWWIRLLVPDFLIGHPNFKPLRTALIVWMIFTLTVGSMLIALPKAYAAGEFQMKTGYYYGNGTTLSVTGVGWKPELLIIKSDTAAGQMVWKSSAMPDAAVSYLGVATADNTDGEIIFDNDGFTVSPALEVNTKNVRYTYIAFYGSDCASADSGMCVGKYTGNGLVSQAVSVTFQPDLVWVKRTSAVVGNFTTSALAAVNPLYGAYFSATANDVAGTGLLYKSLNAGGFTVGLTNNALGAIYYYVTFKNVAGKSIVGSFTGNGTDDRNISGTAVNGIGGTAIGFEPDFVFVKQNAAIGPVFNTTECWGDYSLAVIAGAGALNHIQSLDNTGFQVGNSTAVNIGGILSYWFAFGGAPDPAPTESFFMEKGHYVGDGTGAHVIPTSFAPDLVFIKADNSAQYAVWSLRRDNDLTHYFAVAAVAFAGGIMYMGDDSFTVGNHAAVNTSLINYEYVAFGNATSPLTGAHAADFVIGSYSGNGLTPATAPRVIDHLGMTPDLVVVKAPIVAAASNINFWKSSSMAVANETAYFTATANDTGGTLIRSLGANGGGFTMGSNAAVNTSAVVYNFFAFKEGNGIFDVGTYNGTGVAGREVTGLGFQPDFVWTKRNSTTAAVHRSSSPNITGAYSQYFLAAVNAVDMITGFLPGGFKLGTAVEANTSTLPKTYHYAAWKATTSVNPPYTPINSSPSNLATGVDLNATLTSAYSDQDSDVQTNAQWQVDDDSDFLTPVWTRTAGAAEETTSITSGNGTFANELSGHTELDHNSTYYWRVAYSDGVWSAWSTGTSFATNVFSAPTNQSPTDGGTVTTLMPTLTATAFSDPQETHSPVSAQWQIDTSNSFTSPLYDSGIFVAGNSFAVPSAILSDRSSYHWRVRYLDSGGQWSSYSTATRFLVSKSEILVSPLFGSTVVDEGDSVNIDAQIKLTDGTVVNDATVTVDIYSPTGAKIVPAASMSYIADSSGIYRYAAYAVPVVSGSYFYAVTAVSNGVTGYGAANFEVRTIAADVNSAKSTVEAEQEAQAAERASQEAERESQEAERASQEAERTAQATERMNQAAEMALQAVERLAQEASREKVEDIQTKVTDIQTKIGTLITEIGAGRISAIKTATDSIAWDDVTGIVTSTGLIKDKTDTIDWANVTDIKTKTDTISWGDVAAIKLKTDDIVWGDITDIKGDVAILIEEIGTDQISAIKTATDSIDWSDVTGIITNTGLIKDKTDTIDWANVTGIKTKTDTINWDDVTGIKTNTDTIITQNLDHEAADSAFRDDTTSRLTSIESKIDAITTTLNTVDTNLDFVLSTVNSIRTSQQKDYKATFSDVSEIQAGNTYRAKLVILDFESNPVDASTVPTILIYDSIRGEAQTVTDMEWKSTGVYEYTKDISSAAVTGLYESIVNVDMGGTADIIRNDYWQVAGSPAQVLIESMSDLTVPSISADAIITNEGNGEFEYKYEWCVVSTENDQCGGGDDIYRGTGAKLLIPGESYKPTLTATVPSVGDYWFKMVVYYGTESSGASRTFTAIPEGATDEDTTPSPGGGGSPVKSKSKSKSKSGSESSTGADVYTEFAEMRDQLASDSKKLARSLELLEIVTPAIQGLLSVDSANTESLIDIQNKVSELRAISSVTRKITEAGTSGTVEPIVETYMKFNSVEIHFLITNPGDEQRDVKFKAFLPEEAKPEHVLDKDGLEVAYDATAKTYYVFGEITLGPKESTTRKVEMKDIWVFAPEEIKSIKDQANNLVATLAKTQYEAQGSILKNDIDSVLSTVLSLQEEGYSSPEDHLVAYRDNKKMVLRAEDSLNELGDLVTQAGAARNMLGQVGGIQTFATWGIVLAIVFGIGLLAVMIFAMWRHQTMLVASVMGMNGKTRMPQNREPCEISGYKKCLLFTQESFLGRLFRENIAYIEVVFFAVLVVLALKYVPVLLDGKEIKLEIEKASADLQVVSDEKSDEKLHKPSSVVDTQENVKDVAVSDSSGPELKITDTPTGWLNVRGWASSDATILTKVYPGEEYKYTDQRNGWYKIVLKDKTEGWVSGVYIGKI